MTDPAQPTTPAPPVTPEAQPYPPRFWWLKRILIGVGLLLVLLLALRLWWGWEAHRRFQAQIDQYIAGGEPIYPEDFNPAEPVPDDQNAAKLLMAAAEAINLTPEQTELVKDVAGKPEKVRDHLDELAKLIEANAEALDLVHRSRSLPKADWGVRFRGPAIDFISPLLPLTSAQRALAKLLCTTAAYHHVIGHDAEAIRTLHDVLAQTETVDAHPSLISHLVAIAGRAMVARSIEQMATTLIVNSGKFNSDGSVNSDPTLASETKALIEVLVNHKPSSDAFAQAMLAERMLQLSIFQVLFYDDAMLMTLEEFEGMTPTPLWDRVVEYPFKPIWEMDRLFLLQSTTAYSQAVAQPDYSTAKALSPDKLSDDSLLDQWVHPLSRIFLPSFNRPLEIHFIQLAQTTMSGVALAIRLYELDHGRRPATLAELVPDYLTTVPFDPFAGDQRPIGYKPQATLPILYSIGPDGVDDDGRYTHRPTGGIDFDKMDMPFFLNGRPPEEAESVPDDQNAAEAIKFDDESVLAWTKLGKEALSRGEAGGADARKHYDAAIRALEKALSITPDYPIAIHALASVYMRTGKTEAAAEILKQGIAARPDAASLHAKLGYAFRYAGMMEQSMAAYRTSQRLDASYENLIRSEKQVIKSLIYLGRYNEAVDAYPSILNWLHELGRKPDEKVLFYQGIAHFYAGDTKVAVQMFEASINTDPKSLWSKFAQAYRLAALGETTALIRLADELEHGNVSDGERRYRLVHLYAMAGRTEKALGHLEASARSGFFNYPYTKSDRFLGSIMEAEDFDRILHVIQQRHQAFVGNNE